MTAPATGRTALGWFRTRTRSSPGHSAGRKPRTFLPRRKGLEQKASVPPPGPPRSARSATCTTLFGRSAWRSSLHPHQQAAVHTPKRYGGDHTPPNSASPRDRQARREDAPTPPHLHRRDLSADRPRARVSPESRANRAHTCVLVKVPANSRNTNSHDVNLPKPPESVSVRFQVTPDLLN